MKNKNIILNRIKIFGTKIVVVNLLAKISNKINIKKLKIKVYNIKHKAILIYLSEKYKNIIEQWRMYKNINLDSNIQIPKIIWTMWWQGEENAPNIVKYCIKSLRQHSGEAKVIVLDKTNYDQYITIPDYILKKVENNIITLTNLSDLIRAMLIYNHGGMWIDSTIFVSDNINIKIFKQKLFSIKRKYDVREGGVCFSR